MIEKIAVFFKNLIDWFKSDRCFIKYFIEAFKLTNKNILLLSLLIIFLYTINAYLIIASSYSVNNFLSLSIVALMTAALASGFFYSMKKSIEFYYDDSNKSVTCGTFYSGIGKYYLSFFSMIITFFILGSIVILGTFFLANAIVCNISSLNIDNNIFMVLANQDIIDFSTLDLKQQIFIRNWIIIFLITTQLLTFLVMYWIPEKIYFKKDILSSLFNSVKKIFSDLPNSICIYLTAIFLKTILDLSIINFRNNNIITFILSILLFYLVSYICYAIFLYYKVRFVDSYERNNE